MYNIDVFVSFNIQETKESLFLLCIIFTSSTILLFNFQFPFYIFYQNKELRFGVFIILIIVKLVNKVKKYYYDVYTFKFKNVNNDFI